ncbi:Holliday junction branch migration protein RuvA [Candidatus Peregrinibacteria bacterium]|jgi:holliday junction DNA helicase RuvA|nr:Holliday junction branch migration protein RuvA [Candidatus Peregrinibacteria bacterium]
MISYLSGNVKEKLQNALILNVQGVGYMVSVAQDFLTSVRASQNLELYIYTIVREQEISLYGFKNLQERSLFEQLISVSGIGPRIAMEFFSFPLDLVCNALAEGDTEFLSKVKGVGKKTAERAVIELKNKVGIFEPSSQKGAPDGSLNDVQIFQDAVMALEALGYEKMEIMKQVKKAPVQSSAEEIVNWFLKIS